MKKTVLFILLILAFGGTTKIYCQSLSLVSYDVFEDPAYLLTGEGTCVTECGIGYIVLKANGINYIQSISLDVLDVMDRTLIISVSNTASFTSDNIVADLVDETGVIDISVNKYASYIRIESEETNHPQCGFLYLNEITVYAQNRSLQYTYDLCGNRVARNLIISATITVKEASEKEPQEFDMDENSSILLYPNPTSGILNFEIQNSDTDKNIEVSAKIYSVTGVLISDKKFYSNAFIIDISDEQNGTYLLDMLVNGNEKHFKIIKN